MDESAWSRLREANDRIRWARLRWQTAQGGATTAKAAADSLGMQENTYTAYERPETGKHTKLDHQRAIQFGRKFQTNWVWLLTGEETPFERTEAQDRAMKAMASVPPARQELIAETVEALAKTGTGG